MLTEVWHLLPLKHPFQLYFLWPPWWPPSLHLTELWLLIFFQTILFGFICELVCSCILCWVVSSYLLWAKPSFSVSFVRLFALVPFVELWLLICFELNHPFHPYPPFLHMYLLLTVFGAWFNHSLPFNWGFFGLLLLAHSGVNHSFDQSIKHVIICLWNALFFNNLLSKLP